MRNTAGLDSLLLKPSTDEPGDWICYWLKVGQPWRREPEIGEMRQSYLSDKLVDPVTQEVVARPYSGVRLHRGDIEWMLALRTTKAGAPPNIMDLRGAVLSHISTAQIEVMLRTQQSELRTRQSKDQSEGECKDKNVTQTVERLLEAYGRGVREFICWNLEGAVLKGADLRGIVLSGSNLRKAKMESVNLTGAELSRCDLTDACMERADFTNASILDAKLIRSNFHAARLFGAKLSRSNAAAADFSGADMSRAQLTNTDLTGAVLEAVCLRDSNITGARLDEANLCGTLLPPNREPEPLEVIRWESRGPDFHR